MSYTISIGLVAFTCDSCGGTSGIASEFHRRWVDGLEPEKTIHCPYCGHRWTCGYTRVSELEKKLTSERAAHDQTKADRDYQYNERKRTEKSLQVRKGIITRFKNRITKGMCPCCRRHFGNLWRHMKTQHPDYQQVEE